jgi:two-component system, LuxR family, response regulator FixJ
MVNLAQETSNKMESKVCIVDDDTAVRVSLEWLIESVNLPVKTFANGMEFLDSEAPFEPGCVILDIRMPGLSGIDVFEELKSRSSSIPVIFLTGHGDVHLAVRAMKTGAFDFVEKPFNDQLLLDLVQKAITSDEETASLRGELGEIKIRMDNLTAREREVLNGVVAGGSNRSIAEELNLSEKTIEFHRSKMMEKMEAGSLANLIQMVTILDKAEFN